MSHSEEDLVKIKQVLENYFEGATNGNIDALKEAFHEDCKIYSIDDKGELKFLDQQSFHRVVLENYKTFKRKNMILSMDVSGNTALAKTRADYPSFAFIDYLNILKVHGNWKIINKTTYNLSKTR